MRDDISEQDIRTLQRVAAAAGDLDQVRVCHPRRASERLVTAPSRLFSWSPVRQRDLQTWIARARILGLPLLARNGLHSDAAALGAALAHAAACRCAEYAGREQAREAALAKVLANAPRDPQGSLVLPDAESPVKPIGQGNPLRALRLASGLSQSALGAAMRPPLARSTIATLETRPRVRPETLARAGEAIVRARR